MVSSAKGFVSSTYGHVRVLKTMERAHASFVAMTNVMEARWFVNISAIFGKYALKILMNT